MKHIDPTAVIGEGVQVGRFCEVRAWCVIGERTTFGSRCTLSEGTRIGSDCVVKYGFVACDTPDLRQPEVKVPPVIGNGVLIGANVTVMPGVEIGDGAVIGACSQVRRDVPAGETWYGNPARKHERRDGFDCGAVSVEGLAPR